MQNDLHTTVQHSLRDACQSFPERLQRLVVFVTDSDAPVFISSAIADDLSEKTRALRARIHQESAYIKKRNAAGMAYHPTVLGGVAGIKMIGLLREMPGVFTPRYTLEMRTLYVLDHEIGHQVMERGMIGGHEGECRADAFAALRHIQRFGLDSDFFKYANKASTLVLGTSPIHYTDDILAAVRRHACKHDISALSLDETAALAHDIVGRHMHTRISHHLLAMKFNDAAQAYHQRYETPHNIVRALYGRDEEAYALFCRETAKVMHASADNADVIKAGKRFLNYPPVKEFIKDQARHSEEWQDILRLSNIRVPRQRARDPKMSGYSFSMRVA